MGEKTGFKSPDEWATTKQACRDELVVYLFFLPYIYIYIYIYIYRERERERERERVIESTNDLTSHLITN